MLLYDARGQTVTLDRRIGGGGEGDVYLVAGRAGIVAKVYAKPTAHLRDKLAWMIDHPPDARHDAGGHTTLAWPAALLYADRTRVAFSGFLMPHIAGAVPLLQVFNPRLRARTLPGFDRRYLARTARNLAAVLATLHRSGYVVGDLNESNVLVTPTALVALIDCDSFQVQAVRGGRVVTYPCPVGKLEYTAPEMQGKPFGREVRKPEADRFALAVLIFQLLMEGRHPFAGTWTGSGEPPAVEEKIRRGCFPHVEHPPCPILPPPNTPALDSLPPAVADLTRRCFVVGHRAPSRRPPPEAWRDALTQAEMGIGATVVRRTSPPPTPAPASSRATDRAMTDADPPVAIRRPRPRPARPARAHTAVAKRRPTPSQSRSRISRLREVLATLAGVLIVLGAAVAGGWWLLDHYRLPPFDAAPGTAASATPRPPTIPATTSGGAAGVCTSRTAVAAAATAAAMPRSDVPALDGSWVAYSAALHVRFFGMPWWDDRPATTRGMRYQVGTVPDSPDSDQLDVLRVPGAGGSVNTATWQTEVDTYAHRSTAGTTGALATGAVGNITVTVRPHRQQVAGYDGYIGQFHFTMDAGAPVDATLWVGQVGCDRVVLLFTGSPARQRQIDQAVTQVLATIDFSAP